MTQTLKYPKIQIKSRDLGVPNIGKNISESHKSEVHLCIPQTTYVCTSTHHTCKLRPCLNFKHATLYTVRHLHRFTTEMSQKVGNLEVEFIPRDKVINPSLKDLFDSLIRPGDSLSRDEWKELASTVDGRAQLMKYCTFPRSLRYLMIRFVQFVVFMQI